MPKKSTSPLTARARKSAPHVLLTNDDGHFSSSLLALRSELLRFANVVVVAPATEQSAMSHSLTLHRPLRIREVEPLIFSIDGTPADCVYTALCSKTKLFEHSPKLVISGINHGPNLGQDVFYSGTVAAAREGALRGKTAIAVSAEVGADIARISAFMTEIAKNVLRSPKLDGQLLNFNFPASWNGDLARARLGTRLYRDLVDLRRDPRGRPYAWIGGPPRPSRGSIGTDVHFYERGVATVTPLLLDLTLHEELGNKTPLATALDEMLYSVRASS